MVLNLNIKIEVEISLGWRLIQHTTVNKYSIQKGFLEFIFWSMRWCYWQVKKVLLWWDEDKGKLNMDSHLIKIPLLGAWRDGSLSSYKKCLLSCRQILLRCSNESHWFQFIKGALFFGLFFFKLTCQQSRGQLISVAKKCINRNILIVLTILHSIFVYHATFIIIYEYPCNYRMQFYYRNF